MEYKVFWIGAQRDKNNATNWKWFPSGRNLSYFNWNHGGYLDNKNFAVNRIGLDCVGIGATRGVWQNFACGRVYHFICQRKYSLEDNTHE